MIISLAWTHYWFPMFPSHAGFFNGSLLLHTWFKWTARYQAPADLDNEPFIESGVAEQGDIENVRGCGAPGRGLVNTGLIFKSQDKKAIIPWIPKLMRLVF